MRCSPGPPPRPPGIRGLPKSKPAVRLIVHKTAIAQGQGAPGEVLEAAGEHLVVAAGEGAVALLSIQLPGKKPFTPGEFLRGHRIAPGETMGD